MLAFMSKIVMDEVEFESSPEGECGQEGDAFAEISTSTFSPPPIPGRASGFSARSAQDFYCHERDIN